MTHDIDDREDGREPPTDTVALADAIHKFEECLPGWYWAIYAPDGRAICGPDAGPDAPLGRVKEFRDGFQCDDENGSMTSAIYNVIGQALEMKRRLNLAKTPRPPDMLSADTTALAIAIKEFEERLPGWWWSVGFCEFSRHASCGMDDPEPAHPLAHTQTLGHAFHCDDVNGTLASSLRDVMFQGLKALRRVERAKRKGRDKGGKPTTRAEAVSPAST